jgi:outer membrane protein TolC
MKKASVFTTWLAAAACATQPVIAQIAAPVPNAPAPTSTNTVSVPIPDRVPSRFPHSNDPFRMYMPDRVPEINLTNSALLDSLIRNGKMYLSLQDAIELALENNLDLAIARYNLPIADADIERTRAGASFRGVNTGIVENTPSGGVGGSATAGGGAGGTSGGVGGAGAGASGLVSSTLGTGTSVQSFDPDITANVYTEHFKEPLSNQVTAGVASLAENTVEGNFEYTQSFPTGTMLTVDFDNSRITENSPDLLLNPTLNSYYQVTLQQPLLAGFGFGPNLRYLRIAKNDKRISDYAFRDQVTATISQIADIYWDLVGAFQDEQLKERSLQFAKDTLASDQQQLALQAIPALDVTKAAGEVAARDGDLAIAKVTLESEQSLMKNALTRNLDDPILEAVPVIPTDTTHLDLNPAPQPLEQLIALAMQNRPELKESAINLENENISRKAATNALLPTVNLIGYYGGTGLAGVNNLAAGQTSSSPADFGGAVSDAVNNSAPNYYVGVNINIPLRNRVAKSDQYRSELEFRQSQLLEQQQQKEIRIQVRNAQYALEQSAAHVLASSKARDLAQQSFDISKKEQKLGAGSQLDTLAAQNLLALAESAVATAETAYEKAGVSLSQATGQTLERYHVSLSQARTGTQTGPPVAQGR